MKNILITERQYRLLMEYDFPLEVRRRLDPKALEQLVQWVKDNDEGDPCTWDDPYDYADSIIGECVGEFFYQIGRDLASDDDFSIHDDLITYFKDEFGADLIEYHENECGVNED